MRFRSGLLARGLFLLSAFIVLGGASVQAQSAGRAKRPEGIASIPFGSKVEDVFRVLGQRAGITVPDDLPIEDKIEVAGGTFADQPVQKWIFEFVAKKMVSGAIVMKPASNPVGLYREFKQEITSKYGPATGERKPNEPRPRVEGLQLGNIAYWKFPPTLGDKEQKLISCELSTLEGGTSIDPATLVLTIRYATGPLKSAEPVATPNAKLRRAKDL